MAHKNNMPLHVAAANGFKFKVIRLCMNSELVNEANSLGWTPIMYAAYYGHVDIVKELLRLGAHVSVQNSFGGCIYTLAAVSGNVEIIRALYSHHKIPSEKLIKPLAAAVVFGHLSVVRFLIDNGADPNSSMEYSGVTPLMLAVIENHVEIVKFMVHRGADIVSQNCAGYSALLLANITGNKIIISIFSEKLGYSIDSLPVYASCKNKEAVVQAATNGDVFSLKNLLSHNPSLSTSQHWMSILNEENVKNIGDDDVFTSFEDEKHSIKLKQNNTFYHNTFPAFAGRNNRVGRGDMFGFCYGPYTSSFQYDCSENRQLGMRNRKYTSLNAEINSLAKNTPGSEYNFPLKLPIRTDNSKKVVNSQKRGVKSMLPSSNSGLVRFERNSSEENKMVTSPLILACFNGHIEATRLLIAAGADPNRQRKGRTPLMVAAITSNMELVQLLLSAGADPLVESHVDSLTAFELASLSGAETELLRFIASYTLPISCNDSQSAKSPLLLDPPLKPDCWISPQRILSKMHSLVAPKLQNDSYSWGNGHLWDSKKSKEWMVSPFQKFRKSKQIKARRLFSTPCFNSEVESNVKNYQQWKNASLTSQKCINDKCFNYNLTKMPLDSPFESLTSDEISTVMPPSYIKCCEFSIIEEVKREKNKQSLHEHVLFGQNEGTMFSKNTTLLPPASSFQCARDIPLLTLRSIPCNPKNESGSEIHANIFIPPTIKGKENFEGNFEEYIEKHDLSKYASFFRDNEVADIDIVLSITEDDLLEMGVLCQEERRKIINKIHGHIS